MSLLQPVYVASDPAEAHWICGLLEQLGIPAKVQGEHLGSLRGELPMTPDKLPTVLVSEQHVDAARTCIRASIEARAQHPERTPWSCKSCGELVEAQFTQCWSCGLRRHSKD